MKVNGVQSWLVPNVLQNFFLLLSTSASKLEYPKQFITYHKEKERKRYFDKCYSAVLFFSYNESQWVPESFSSQCSTKPTSGYFYIYAFGRCFLLKAFKIHILSALALLGNQTHDLVIVSFIVYLSELQEGSLQCVMIKITL